MSEEIKQPKQTPTLDEVAIKLEKNPEIISLGKVWHTTDLLSLINEINTKLVKKGDSIWRLPTKAELITSQKANDGHYGNRFTWSGDVDTTTPNCLYIVNMENGEQFGDSDGSEVEAYLIKA